jgi:quercetin dioxygenase-like cupin family protein
MKRIVVTVGMIALLGGARAVIGQEGKDHGFIQPSEVKWGSAPASVPAGAQGAVLQGDPANAGPFTLRLKLPDGYRIPPHYHPAIEHITVIQGTFVLGMGDKVNSATEKPLGAGSFAFMPAGMRHFVRAQGETIVQLHGTGPWGITYVDPSDDPRKKQD